jgi:fructuronate reductase/mannitol 2-dehydrogenase
MSRPTPLSDATLPLHAGRVAVPAYDRTALVPSVVHMSVGSFHRSHQAVYFDELAQRGISRDWGLVGVGLFRRDLREALPPQDGLYTVVTRGAGGDTARVVGAMVRYLYAPERRHAVVAALADERTRLVTLTVTGPGYRPGRALDLLVEALDRRRHTGLPPFTVLSCDNLPDNGALARQAVVACAARRDPRLARWIEQRGAFPSSMVDRITPQTTAADRTMVARRFGVVDRAPVITEPFSQWVIEDDFCAGRPPLDRVGAQFVDDVRPYALIKTRLLNGSHCALGPLGTLAGHRTTAEAIADPVFRAFVERMMRDEVAPLLPAPLGHQPAAYRAELMTRLANPRLTDPLSRLCRNGAAKVAVHLLPSVAEARAAGRPHPLLTLAVAGALRHLADAGERPAGLDGAFRLEVDAALAAIDRDGARAAVAAAVTAGEPVAA